MNIYSFNDLKFTLKHLKRSTCFDHTIILRDHTLFLANVITSLTLYDTQRTSIARLTLNSTRLTQYTRHAATAPTQRNDVNHWVFLNYNFSSEQCMLPEDDRMIEICRSVLSVLM